MMVLIKNNILFFFGLVLFIGCKKELSTDAVNTHLVHVDTFQGTSFLNKPLIRRQLDVVEDSLKILNYNEAFLNFNSDSTSLNNIIWLGRRIAYLGDYKKAINIYSKGLTLFPENPRLYRHRGHRYISTRELDKAITDLKKASDLIQGKEDIIEKDGIPNAKNIPLSTLHNNIWYHLGLSYYLKHDLPKALQAFQSCLYTSSNDDMQVATRHWLYMILRRMSLPEEASNILKPIHGDMIIIENTAYFNMLLFYKGELTLDDLIGNHSLGASEAIQYGVANWYYYNNKIAKAKNAYQNLILTGNWAAFGYIAAESDYARIQF